VHLSTAVSDIKKSSSIKQGEVGTSRQGGGPEWIREDEGNPFECCLSLDEKRGGGGMRVTMFDY